MRVHALTQLLADIYTAHGISDGKLIFTFRNMRFLQGKFRRTAVKEGHEAFDTSK